MKGVGRRRGTVAVWRNPFTSLPARIGCLVFGATLLVSLSVTGLAVESQRAFARAEVERRLPTIADASARELERWCAARTDELGELSTAPALREALARLADPFASARARARARARIDVLLARSLENHDPFVSLIAVADRNAAPVWVGAEFDLGAALVAGPMDSRPTSATAVAELAGQPLPILAADIEAPDGRRIGHLYALAAPDAIESLLASPQVLSRGSVHLRADATHASQAPPPHRDEPPVSSYEAPDGTRVLASARPLPGHGLVVVVEEPVAAVLAPVAASTRRLLAVNLVMTLVLGLAAYRVAASIVAPIEALSCAARQLAEGERPSAIPESEDRDEVGLLTRTFNQMADRLARKSDELEARNRELQRANEALEQLSITDGLTRLHNHRFFQDHLAREAKRALRSRRPLSLVLIDIDHFKRWNDRLGHAAGDEVLRRVAIAMCAVIRDSDLLARYGGEEFALVAPNTDLAGAIQLAEKIRQAVAAERYFLDPDSEHRNVTVSIGVASFEGDRTALFAAADRNLYRAKAAGRDCVMADGEA